MIVSSIAAVSENNVIGRDNDLPWHLPDDFKWFKSVTSGHHILMGRRNYEAMGSPLPGRTNIVITRKENYQAPGCIVVHSIEEGLDLAKKNGEEEAFIIGGGEIYKQAMPLTDKLYITHIHATIDGDTFFPDVNLQTGEWKKENCEKHEQDERHQYSFTICVYSRKT